jgi:chemotaxis protein MotB
MARKKYVEDAENHERWLISYADFITLLFAFFVVMYAVSVVNEGKYRVLSDALGSAFGGKGGPDAGAPRAEIAAPITLPNIVARRRAEAMRRERERLTSLARDLSATLAPLVKEGKVRVTQNSRGVSVEINASVLFDSGDATLTADSREALAALAVFLRNDPHALQVEGHTDNQQIRRPAFPSNWELSAARAGAVVRLFADAGVPAERMTVVGHGSNVPVATNDSAEGRARNRRVAVTILSAVPDASTEIAPR